MRKHYKIGEMPATTEDWWDKWTVQFDENNIASQYEAGMLAGFTLGLVAMCEAAQMEAENPEKRKRFLKDISTRVNDVLRKAAAEVEAMKESGQISPDYDFWPDE